MAEAGRSGNPNPQQLRLPRRKPPKKKPSPSKAPQLTLPPHRDPAITSSFKRTFNCWLLSPERMRLKATHRRRKLGGLLAAGVAFVIVCVPTGSHDRVAHLFQMFFTP
jgi:hypothetical protein